MIDVSFYLSVMTWIFWTIGGDLTQWLDGCTSHFLNSEIISIIFNPNLLTSSLKFNQTIDYVKKNFRTKIYIKLQGNLPKVTHIN